MVRFFVAKAAQSDLARIVRESRRSWSDEAARRYAMLLDAAMNHVAEEPHGPLTRDGAQLRPDLRTFHVRHARRLIPARVKAPAHLLVFRIVEGGLVEIVRVLHERMDPVRHIVPDNDVV